MTGQGLAYYIQSDSTGKALLSVRSALALDLFSQCYDAQTFVNRPLGKGDIASILEDCLEAADVLLSNKKQKE